MMNLKRKKKTSFKTENCFKSFRAKQKHTSIQNCETFCMYYMHIINCLTFIKYNHMI